MQQNTTTTDSYYNNTPSMLNNLLELATQFQ